MVSSYLLCVLLGVISPAAMGSEISTCHPGDDACTPGNDRSMLQVRQQSESMKTYEDDERDEEEEEGPHSYEIYKPSDPDVPKPMPVLIGSYREDELIEAGDGGGYATVIWKGSYKVGKSTISGFDICKNGHPVVALFGQILDAIDADPDLDSNRVAVAGFSATAKAGMLAYCHADRLTGIYASCSGFDVRNSGCGKSLGGACNSIKKKRAKVKPPPGLCEECKKAILDNCEVQKPCDVTSIYPCYKKKPFIMVAQTGKKDYYKYESDILYSAAKAEGLDARYQVWDFGHTKPKELGAVMMGTFGFGEPCPQECETAVATCRKKKNFNQCFALAGKAPPECPKFCVPTLSMLSLSEDTLISHEGNYGPVQKMTDDRPASSKCSFDDAM